MATIANQRLQKSIQEDAINKPWRPLPMQRLTPGEATRLLHWVIPVVYLVGEYTGSQRASAYFLAFSYMYNDLDGANKHMFVRNLLNACGYSCFSVGASIIAAGRGQHSLLPKAYTWIYLLGVVIATTIHTQDFADVRGDRLRGRRTVPLVYGDSLGRWSAAILVMTWSVLCPALWQGSVFTFVLPLALGTCLSVNILSRRSEIGDALSWKIWCVWIIALYLLPIMLRA